MATETILTSEEIERLLEEGRKMAKQVAEELRPLTIISQEQMNKCLN